MDEFDDTEMQDLDVKYPEYGDMDITGLNNEYGNLSRERLNILRNDYIGPDRLDEINEKKDYLERLLKLKKDDDDMQQRLQRLRGDDGQTVTIDRSRTKPRRHADIKRKEQRSRSDPEVGSNISDVDISTIFGSPIPPNVEAINPSIAVQDFIQREFNLENFRLFDPYDDNKTATELQLNIDTTSGNSITYKPKTNGSRNKTSC